MQSYLSAIRESRSSNTAKAYDHALQAFSVVDATTIIADLASRIGLMIGDKNFIATTSRALEIAWTRNPFERIIVAGASLDDSILVSKDQNILRHYPFAKW